MPKSIPKWRIRAEEPGDAEAIAWLTDDCFGPGRFAKSAWRLREGVSPVEGLGFVADDGTALRGAVRFWPIRVGAKPALLLGPLAVQSDLRGLGIGISLMQTGIDAARRLGHQAIILVGDAPYYGRVGFRPLPAGRLRFPGPVDSSRVLGLALGDGALDSLAGDVLRGPLNDFVCADSTPLAPKL